MGFHEKAFESRALKGRALKGVRNRFRCFSGESVVAVGMALSGHPPHGSVHEELPHTALTLGSDGQSHSDLLAVRHPDRTTPRAGAVSGRWPSECRSPWSIPFPPRTPPPEFRLCSPASLVLRDRPTPRRRTRRPFGIRLLRPLLAAPHDNRLGPTPMGESRVAADKAAVLRVQVPPYQFVHFRYVAISQVVRATARALREVNGPAARCTAPRSAQPGGLASEGA